MQQALCNNYGAVREEFADQLQGEGLKVLDIGCSTGASIAKIFDFDRLDYTGLDLLPEYVEVAKRRNPKGKFLAMDATHLDFPDASFDRALFLGVWHHMPDDVVRAALAGLQRVLKPGGKVLIAEPLFTPGRALSTFFLRHDRGHFIREREQYKALIQGWKIERERSFDFSLHRFLSLVLVKEA
jgi:ubiquinone/menaquinone biosynthesis C-methylase UbiE